MFPSGRFSTCALPAFIETHPILHLHRLRRLLREKKKSAVAAQAEKLHWEGGSSRSWADAQIQGMQSVI